MFSSAKDDHMDHNRTNRVLLVPIGEIPDGLMDWLAPRLEAKLGVQVDKGNPIEPPEDAWDSERRQFRGEKLLSYLGRAKSHLKDRVVGLIDSDSYSNGLNFIFGQAEVHGRNALVALPRLRPDLVETPDDIGRFYSRVLKEVIHELGHTWGIPHCPDHTCVMHFSNRLADTDLKGESFCQSCQNRL